MAQTDAPDWSVIAHRLNLDFVLRNTGDTQLDFAEWDAIAIPDFDCVAVYYANVIKFHPTVDGGTVPNNISVPTTTSVANPSLFYDESTSKLYLFRDSAGLTVNRREYTVTLGDSTFVEEVALPDPTGTNEVISAYSAVSDDRIHYAIFNVVTKLTNLRVSDLSDVTNSDIWYQYPIQSFEACEYNNSDVIVVATQTPGMVSTKAELDQTYRYIEHSGGVLSWVYSNGQWSNHYEVDVVDNISETMIRRNVRLSVTHDRLTLTCFAATGELPYAISSYRHYHSKDGKHWSIGRILSLDEPPTYSGLKIVAVDDIAFALDAVSIYVSDCTMELGYSSPNVQLDISDDIASYSYSQNNASSASITIENQDGAYDGHELININNQILLYHYAGYWVDEELLMVLIGITEVDTLEFVYEADSQVINVVSRDFLAWMTDKYTSENSEYWEGQLVGADDYKDNTTTRYGGLRHSATQAGTWHTAENKLELRSNNKEGISFNTHNPYIWNGSYQSEFELSALSGTEYAGLVFRALDKDNLWHATYFQSTDTIQLRQRKGGTDTLKASSPTLSWNADTNVHYLRVVFYYAHITVYYSGDGITWTEAIDYYANGIHDIETVGNLLLDKGYVGQIASGYDPQAEWSTPEFNSPDFDFSPFDFNLPISLPMPLSSDPPPEEEEYVPAIVFATAPEREDSKPSGVKVRHWSVTYDFSNSIVGLTDKNYDGQVAFDKFTMGAENQAQFVNGRMQVTADDRDLTVWIDFGSEQRIDDIKVQFQLYPNHTWTQYVSPAGFTTHGAGSSIITSDIFLGTGSVYADRAYIQGRRSGHPGGAGSPSPLGSGGYLYIQIWGYGDFNP